MNKTTFILLITLIISYINITSLSDFDYIQFPQASQFIYLNCAELLDFFLHFIDCSDIIDHSQERDYVCNHILLKKENHMKKKILTLLILAAMLVCLLPTAAFALKPGDALPYSKYCSACGQTALHMYLDGYTKGTYNASSGDCFHIIHAHDDWEHTLDHEQRCFTPRFGDYTIEYAQLSASSGQDPARYHKATCVCGLSLNKEHNYSEYQSGKRSCSDCGYVQTCDHSGNTNPTCLSTTCSVCGGTVPKTEHIRAQFKHDERGHWAYCTKCDSILSRVLPHTWDNGVVTDPGTCLAPGSMKYTCTACGEKVKVRIPLATGLYEYCPDCHGITLHRKEAYTVVESPTEFSEGLKEARHECKYCGAKYIVGHKIHRTHTSSSHNSFDF